MGIPLTSKTDSSNLRWQSGVGILKWPGGDANSIAQRSNSPGMANLDSTLRLGGTQSVLRRYLPASGRSGGAIYRNRQQALKACRPRLTLLTVPYWLCIAESGVIPGSEKLKLAISAGAPLSIVLEQAVFAARGLKDPQFLRFQRVRWNCLRCDRHAADRHGVRGVVDEEC